MRKALIIAIPVLLSVAATFWLIAENRNGGKGTDIELLNVSYDPTRELWRDINRQFADHYRKETGISVNIKQSHGGSSSQARAVIDGLDADVVTLAIPADTDAISRKDLIAADWEKRLPNNGLPYYSTIVFVVRKGNPRGIKDWSDLVQDNVQIITPNPRTSGNGKLSFIAAWGWAIRQGKSEADARAYVQEVFRRVPVLDSGARGATVTFTQKKLGDVHLTWENEARLELQEAPGELEIVYPSSSILAEPKVAWVDANVDRKGTRAAAEAYLKFLYTDEAQETIARHFYRPSNKEVLQQHAATLPPIDLFPITTVAKSWNDAFAKFFGNDGEFDRIYQPGGN